MLLQHVHICGLCLIATFPTCPRRETDTHDFLWSTPQRLYLLLDNTLRAYDDMRQAAMDRLNTSEESVTPRKVRIMRELRDEILRRYL